MNTPQHITGRNFTNLGFDFTTVCGGGFVFGGIKVPSVAGEVIVCAAGRNREEARSLVINSAAEGKGQPGDRDLQNPVVSLMQVPMRPPEQPDRTG
ncbi:Hypp2926 [Branchiostoma lanceolatum]|uniref:Hypp2926 protein n=1 Tax=Branchiostoma lanceolatum TaxID=7740 RepID=A0A8J9ZVE0_BRALA|nr:Hypp2926 [Branchiostoma lanceolatum]